MRAHSGTEVLFLLEKEQRDLILLDLMLPGDELLPHLAGITIIVVSARVATEAKVNFLLGGAANYITKPFPFPELLAQITVQLRQGETPPELLVDAGSLRLDTDSHILTLGEDSRAADSHRIRDFKVFASKARPGFHPLSAAGTHQPGHPRLLRWFSKAAHPQS